MSPSVCPRVTVSVSPCLCLVPLRLLLLLQSVLLPLDILDIPMQFAFRCPRAVNELFLFVVILGMFSVKCIFVWLLARSA